MYRIASSLFLLLLAGALSSCTRGLANGPAPQPTVTFSANPTTVNAGQSATLTWSSTNATSAQIDNGIGAVQPSGTMMVTPQQTTTYNITVMGAGGTATAAATVTVNAPVAAPTVTLTANPAAINSGQSSTLTWSSTNATSLSIDNGIGAVQASGTQTVSPTQTTTYTITATGAGGTVTAQATVTVNAAPTVTITANPTSITAGQSSTLTVVATNATQVVISNNVDQTTNQLAATGGTLAVTPTQTTTYTATATGANNQTAAAMATVTVTTPQDVTAINHVIFMMQENRSFDSYFGMLNPYRKANNLNIGDDGKEYDVDGIDDKLTKIVNVDDEGDKFSLFKLTSTCIDDDTSAWLESFGDVKRFDRSATRQISMDGFVHNSEGYAKFEAQKNPSAFTDLQGKRAMGFYDQGFLNYYYFMASDFALSDRWFSPVASKTALNRIATFSGGTTQGDVHDPLNDDKFPQLTYETIFQELSQANVSWKIYYSVTDDLCPVGSDDCTHSSNPLPATTFLDFNYSSNFLVGNPNHGACPSNMQPSSTVGDKTNSFCIDTSHIAPITQYFKDVAAGTLPSFAFIEPGFGNNDEHPGQLQPITAGQHQVSTIINALMQSPSWADSVFFFSFDEGGGPFDHVPPVPNHTNDFTDANLGVTTDISSIAVNPDQFLPCPAQAGNIHCDLTSSDPGFNPTDVAAQQGFAAQLGFRVPNMIISPFVRKHYVSHTPMDHTAIIKFVESRFIGSSAHLTNRDAAQPDLLEFFDFVNVPWKIPPTGIPTPSTAKACHADNMGP